MDIYLEDLDYYSPHMTIPEFLERYHARTNYHDFDDDEDDLGHVRFIIGSRSSSCHGWPEPSARSTDGGLSAARARSLSSLYQDEDTERKSKSLQQTKKQREKAEKKRLKNQKRKEKRMLEKLEKADQDSDKAEGKEEASRSDTEKSKSVINNAGAEASAKDIDGSSSENDTSDDDAEAKDDSDEFEELDMASCFVSKAALIAKRKMEANKKENEMKPDKKEKKKSAVKLEPKAVPIKPSEDVKAGKEDSGLDSAAARRPSPEDNIKISNDLANLGNQFASSGDFSRAVKYFTDAIIYNPTEIKLFGNRSLCFEKMQEYGKALADAELCLNLCPGWVKGLFRKGRALAGLKRYEEAAEAFRELLKVESSSTDAAQELMRVQTMQLIEYGYPLKQSTNALIIHGTVEKALEALSSLNLQPGAAHNGTSPPAQVANVNGVSPVLSANKHAALPPSHDAPKIPLNQKPAGLGHNMLNMRSHPRLVPNHNKFPDYKPQELFPVWLGNLFYPVTETIIVNLFSKAGHVHSVKLLTERRCAFVNYTKQEDCEEAIRSFNGFELNGTKIIVRYPDRIPPGMGISKSALKAKDLKDEYIGLNNGAHGRNMAGNRRPAWPQKPIPNYKGNQNQ